MTPTEAAWVRAHAWPVRLRTNYAAAVAHDVCAADRAARCVCQLNRPSHWCGTGRHHKCSIVWGNAVPEASLGCSDGLHPVYYPGDGRMVMVWLADRTCRRRCSCDCHRAGAQEPRQLGLFEAVAS